MANIFRTTSAKFYQNRPCFLDDVTKTFGVLFGFAVPVAVHLQNILEKSFFSVHSVVTDNTLLSFTLVVSILMAKLNVPLFTTGLCILGVI